MAAIAVAVLFIPSAFAVHDTGAFELDGNAAAQTTDDWDRVCYQVLRPRRRRRSALRRKVLGPATRAQHG